jgi:hypothetical protein
MNIEKLHKDCAFHVHGEICSTKPMISKMYEFLKKKIGEKEAKNDKEVVEKIKKYTNCGAESCILNKSEFVNFAGKGAVSKELKERFKPEGPALTKEWLSNFNIDQVLDQWEIEYKSEGFFHIPFQMRDFAKYAKFTRNKDENLETIDLYEKYMGGTRCCATVINTDYSTGSGQHWFAIFCDFRREPFTIEYFNSSGNLPLVEMDIWMEKTKMKLNNRFNGEKKIEKVIVTRIIHQRDDHSCGPYALYYILSRLEGIPWQYFRENQVTDEQMILFRKYLFRLDV